MTKKNLLTYIMAWMAALSLHAQQTTMQGTVADSETGERLPYVALRFRGTTIGTSTDDQGRFTLATATPGDSLEVSYLGYDTKLVPIRRGRLNRLDIRLMPSGITTEEVVVRPGKERYSRRDNPAVRFVREVIRRRDEGDPRQHDFFSYDRYERLIIARNDYKPKERKDGKTGRFDFVRGLMEGERPKPDKKGVEDFIELCKATCEDVTMVGDSEVDWQTARNAGVRPLIVSYGYRSALDLVGQGIGPLASSVEELGRELLN